MTASPHTQHQATDTATAMAAQAPNVEGIAQLAALPADEPVRLIARVTIPGDAVSFRLDNTFGTAPVTIESAFVGPRIRGALLADGLNLADNTAEQTQLMQQTSARTEIAFTLDRNGVMPAPIPSGGGATEEHLRTALTERVRSPFVVDATSEPGAITVLIPVKEGVLSAAMSYKRLNTSTTLTFA